MRQALIISFDLLREGEPETTLSIASLLAHLKSDPGYGDEFQVEHAPVNLLCHDSETAVELALNAILTRGLGTLDTIAVSCYVWAEREVKHLIRRLRESGYRNKIVLGGPQISYAAREQLAALYPQADIFITGYAEQSIRSAILMDRPSAAAVLAEDVAFHELRSPYLSGEMSVAIGQGRVRMESRRGCPFRCAFCAHRDLKRNMVHRAPLDRAKAELDFLATRKVGKVNFLDPVFNQGAEYLSLMQHMVETRFQALVTFQSRFELIRNAEGEQFLDYAGGLNAHLEFGLQTAIASEAKAINRGNRRDAVQGAMRRLSEAGISYEVSLIYGLPGQTLQSFAESILFLRDNGCERISAFPPMLLRGTELHAQKDRWGFTERPEGRFGIPVVYESHSFSESDWLAMRQIADELAPTERI